MNDKITQPEQEKSELYRTRRSPGEAPYTKLPGGTQLQKPGSTGEGLSRGRERKFFYTQSRFSTTVLSTGTESRQILPYSPRRNYLLLQNKGGASIFVTFDRSSDITVGLEIVPGGFYEPLVAPVSSVNIISTVVGVLTIAIEGVL